MSGPLGSQQWMYASGGFYPYEIDQSLRFNDDDSAYLSRTPASNGNRKTFTFSFWTKPSSSTQELFFGSRGSPTVTRFEIGFYLGKLFIQNNNGSSWNLDITSSALFRDFSAWYHIVFAVDTTQATASNRVKLYVNGVEQSLSITTSPSLNLDLDCMITTATSYVGTDGGGSNYFDGYMSDYYFIDGQALDPTSFGEFKSGVWIPKSYSGSYGTNGFYLDFGNSGSLGADSSGNGNNWTPTNLAATDQVPDSPTNNFATLNATANAGSTFSEGNLKFSFAADGTFNMPAESSTISIPSSGKYYFEAVVTTSTALGVGIQDSTDVGVKRNSVDYAVYYLDSGNIYTFINGSSTNVDSSPSSFTTGDVIGIGYDADTNSIAWYKNGVFQTSYTPATGYEFTPSYYVYGSTAVANFGQDSSFAGNKTAQGNTDANGIGDFYYAPPAGYLALCTANLPDPAIDPAQDDVPADYFNTSLWAGNSSTQTISGMGFQPDLAWIKGRNVAYDSALLDAVRGGDQFLRSSTTAAEINYGTGLGVSFNSDGYDLGSAGAINQSGYNYVGWNWLAGNGTSSNTDGTITSTVSANQKAGFSIVSYTGNGISGATFGHGLSRSPEMVIVKNRSNTGQWAVGSDFLTSWSYGLELDSTDAEQSHSNRFLTQPTSSVVTIDTSGYVNTSGDDYIAYCFHSVEGYSKFGSYTGNGSSDGPFVYTGFRPAFVMIKDTGSTEQWQMVDSARDTYNVVDSVLFPNSSGTEASASSTYRDFLSNGFKVRTSDGSQNASGRTYIYMAFAEMPFKYSNAR